MLKTTKSRVISTFQNVCRVAGLDNAVVFEPPPACGLANLLRGLTSALLFAEENNRRFFIHWGRNADMAAIKGFSDLFARPVLKGTAASHKRLNRLHRQLGYFQGRRVLRISDWLKHELTPHHQFNTILCDMVANNIKLAVPTIFISTYYAFHAGPVAGADFFEKRHRLYRRFRPAPAIRARCQAFIQRRFGKETIGVHIRTKKSVRNAVTGEVDGGQGGPVPFDRYFALLDEEIEHHPNLKILLATDNVTECRPVFERYGKRVLTYPKKTTNGMVHRFTAEDHQTALIDLYLLAATRKLLGTHLSTFSYEAAVLGNVPFIEVAPAGLRQTYRLVGDQTVLIDLRDNGLGSFAREMVYDKQGGRRTSFDTVDVADKPVLEWLYGELKKIDNPVWFDAGAGTGAYTLVSKFVAGCRAYAFEPDRTLSAVLQTNLALNHAADRVTVCEFGLADTPGECPAAETTPIQIKTIDHFVSTAPVEKLDFLRIHAPGSEGAILKGAENTLRKFKPSLLLEAGPDTAALVGLAASLGYRYRPVGVTHLFCEFDRRFSRSLW